MDYRFGQEDEAFRREVRDFFHEALPSDWLGVDQDMNNQDEFEEVYRLGLDIRKKLGGKGWLEISWPPEYGGLGASMTKQFILEEEVYYLGVPGYDQPTFGVCGPVVYQLGTEEQRRRFVLPVARRMQNFKRAACWGVLHVMTHLPHNWALCSSGSTACACINLKIPNPSPICWLISKRNWPMPYAVRPMRKQA